MTLTEHLEELRWCLLKSFAAIILASGLCYFFSDAIFKFMVAPLRQSLRPGQSLIGTAVTEAFFVEIKVALAGGVFFASPVIFYQIWRFISPGLSLREKKLVLPFVFCATLFFLGGTFFCYRLVLPVAFQYFFEQYGTIGVTPAIRIGGYFTFFFPYGFSLWGDLRVAGFYLFLSASGHLELSADAQFLSIRHCRDLYRGRYLDADARCYKPISPGRPDAFALSPEHWGGVSVAKG